MLGPLLGGLILTAVNRMAPNQGYIALNVLGAVYFLAGALTIWKVRVR